MRVSVFSVILLYNQMISGRMRCHYSLIQDDTMKSETTALKTALPLYLEGTNGKAVLLQHGYNGSPREMYGLAERLHREGYSVVVTRLPGHGTNAGDFHNSGARLWHTHVRNEYINLRSRFDSVSIVGLSMGGVLSLLIAEEFKPDTVILLAPAMILKQRIVYFMPILKFFSSDMKRAWPPEADADEDRRFMIREYWSHYYPKQLTEMLKLIKKAKRGLHAVESPVYLMLSETDASVLMKAGTIIKKGIRVPVEEFILKNSPHVFFEGPENDIVLDKVVEWLNQHTPPAE